MATGTYKPKADPLNRPDDAKGFRVGWKYKTKFERGHLDKEMTFGQAKKKAEELAAKEPDKTFWPELMYEE